MDKKRLIDANELKKRILALATAWRTNVLLVDAIIDRIDTESTADAVEVVRCKDCKHYHDHGVNREYCCHRSKDERQVFDVKFKADDFCSYGEKRGDCV